MIPATREGLPQNRKPPPPSPPKKKETNKQNKEELVVSWPHFELTPKLVLSQRDTLKLNHLKSAVSGVLKVPFGDVTSRKS